MANGPFYDDRGRYRCEITEQALAQSSNGNPQLVLKFTVRQQLINDDWEWLDQQYSRRMYLTITEKTVDRIIEDLQALPWDADAFAQWDPGHPVHVSLVGRTFDAYCQHKQGLDGKPREEWLFGRTFTERALEVKPLPQAEVRKLDAMFGKKLKGGNSPAAKPKPQPAARMAPGVTAEDVPF